jgi:hypothetical protein
MARRRKRNTTDIAMTADPGKDLFAYLFLMIMVFCFMLMMAAHEVTQSMQGQESPEKQQAAGSSSLAAVSEKNIGRLMKKDSRIYLRYGDQLYSPEKDIDKLTADGHVLTLKDKDDVEKQMLFIEETNDQQVLLTEYLFAFQHLSADGVGVAFAERVHE